MASIRDDHLKTAEANLNSPAIRLRLAIQIDEECSDLLHFLAAVQKIQEVTPRSLDIIIGKGEILSCRFMTALLEDNGVDAQFVDLSNVLNIKLALGVGQNLFSSLITALRTILPACGSAVPVLTGYFGNAPGGLLSQVGRGYTDLCAALVAVSLAASELQVWKEYVFFHYRCFLLLILSGWTEYTALIPAKSLLHAFSQQSLPRKPQSLRMYFSKKTLRIIC